MTLKRATIGYIERLETDNPGIQVPGAVSTLPAENLRSLPLVQSCRVIGTSMQIDITWPGATDQEVIAAIGTDLVSAATYRVQLSNVALGGVDVLDTGVVLVGAPSGYRNAYMDLGGLYSALYTRVLLSSPNASMVTVGRLVVYGGDGLWQPSHAESIGRTQGNVDNAVHTRLIGGQVLSRPASRWQALTWAIDLISEDEMSRADDLQILHGTQGNLLVMLDSANNPHRLSVWGRLTDIRPIVAVATDANLTVLNSAQFTVEQRL